MLRLKVYLANTTAAPGVERYELLPYHRLGRGKYRNIGREYQLGDIVPPSKEKMKELEAVVSKLGLRRE